MLYILLLLFLKPFFWILSFIRKPKGGTLLIQTAKIGDYVNVSVMFDALKQTDVLIDSINLPFAQHDSRIQTTFCINPYKKGLPNKLRLAFRLFWQGYDTVYIALPNSLNLFLVQLALPRHASTLITYGSKNYIQILATGMKQVHHTKEDLTIDSYLKMIAPDLNHNDHWKKISEPLLIPSLPKLASSNRFKIGISIAAGNKIKTIDPTTWHQLFGILREIACDVYIFGLENEAPYLEALDTSGPNIISLLGKIPLQELPWHISQMNLYISSDTGNSYIADSFQIPLINFAGPCYMQEQRPIGDKALIVESNAPCVPFSFIFKAPYEKQCDNLYTVTESQLDSIRTHILQTYRDFSGNPQ